MLLSATIVFFPLVSIGGIEISIKSAIQSVYSGYGSSGAATGLISALGSYAKPYIVMALGWFLFTVLSAVSVLMAKKKTAYLSAIIEQVIQIFIAVSLYMKVKRKLSLVYSAISFVGLGNGVKVHILPILFWVVLQIICFIINIMEITTKEETMMEVLPPVLPVWNDIQGGDSGHDKKVPFDGALIGKSGEYAGLAFQMKEKGKIFFCEENAQITIQERLSFKEKNVLAEVYYTPEYEEYCITPAKIRTIFLESGQPLGEGRLYYLPRETKIRVQDSDAENWFELA